MDRRICVCLAVWVLFAAAAAAPFGGAPRGAPVEHVGFAIWNMMSGMSVYTACRNSVSHNIVLIVETQVGSRELYDLSVLDPGQPHEQYVCAFDLITESGQDSSQIVNVVWATGSEASLMPQFCSLCVWSLTDSGLSIMDNTKPPGTYKFVKPWKPLHV